MLKCNEKYFKDQYVVYFESKGKHFIYFYDEEILEITDLKKENEEENKNKKKDEELNKNENNKKDNENNKGNKKQEKDENVEQIIIKSLILLYANEKYFQKLLESPIVDEYDLKNYYLINPNFIEEYKENNEYKKVSEILEAQEYNYSYKGFCFNIDKILEIPQLKKLKLKKKQYEEKIFYPNLNKIKSIKKDKTFNFPDKFILVPKNLFDLLYKNINEDKYSQEDYKYKILIGDGTLFIQNKDKESEFGFYRYIKSYFKIYYYLIFDEEISFYEDINNSIKGKGLLNYVIERELDTNKKENFNNLYDIKKHTIGKYINIRKIEKDEINEFKSRAKLNKLKEFIFSFNNLANNLWKLQKNDIDITNINDICKKINKEELSVLPIGIVLNDDLINLKKKIYFKEITDLLNTEENKEYKKKDTNLKKQLVNFNEGELNQFLQTINIYDPKSLDKEEEKNSIFNLINIDIINIINEAKNSEVLQDCYYFKNKDDYFIIFAERKKLYKIVDYNEQKDNFKLEEYGVDNNDSQEKKIDYEIFGKNIKGLEKNNDDIEKKLKSNFEKVCSMDEYYLVSSKWIDEFKKEFKDQKKIKKGKISEFLFKENNLRPENMQNEVNYKNEIPIDFEIINKKLFNSILENINSLKKNLNLHSDYIYNVSFGANLIFSEYPEENDIFIYSKEDEKYKLEYIISLEKENKIKDLIKEFKDFQSFLNKYELNLLSKEAQDIKIEVKKNKKKTKKTIGKFICINPKQEEDGKEEEEKEKEEDQQEDKKKETETNKRKKRRRKNSDTEEETEKLVHCLGLENIGATCYMNATIQCLCHVSKLKDFFLNGALINSVTNDRNCPLTLEFANLVKNLWRLPRENNNKDYYKPTDFKNTISQMNKLFEGIAANDSKDLILFIYETIHKEINSVPYNWIQYNLNNCNNDMELMNFRNSYYSVNSSALVDIFYFEVQTCIQCTSCKFTKVSYNVANMLIFPLEKVRQYVFQISNGQKNNVNLDFCFKQNQLGENLAGQNQIFCNNCRLLSDAIMVNYLYTSPEVLTIILNRGKGLQFQVDFTLDHFINIDDYVIDKSSGKSNFYELIGILCHFGPSGMAGHFIAFCKSPIDHNWYCYNDATVTKCDGDPELSSYGNVDGIPYVLYYQRYENEEEKKENFIKEQMKSFIQNNENMTNNNNNSMNINFNNNNAQYNNNFVNNNASYNNNNINNSVNYNNNNFNNNINYDNNNNFNNNMNYNNNNIFNNNINYDNNNNNFNNNMNYNNNIFNNNMNYKNNYNNNMNFINNNFNNNPNNVKQNNYIGNEDRGNTKKDKSKIFLKCQYNDNSYDVEISRKKTFEDLIIKLHNEYGMPNEVMILSEKNNMQAYDISTKIKNSNLDDNDVLIFIDL